MNAQLMILEILVVVLGLGILLADLWLPAAQKRNLGYVAAAVLAVLLIVSFKFGGTEPQYLFGRMYVVDDLALFFKRLFLLAAVIVLVMAVEFADRIEAGISEFYALILFALAGMMFAASANDFALLFVSVELITVTFYILNSFQRGRLLSLEAGVKYLIIGALSSAFMVYGIALIFGTTGKLNFAEIAAEGASLAGNKIFLLGILFVFAGLGFKIAAFPVQMWAPDVSSGFAHAGDGIPGDWLEGGGFCLAPARVICGSPGTRGAALGPECWRGFLGADDPLRQPLRDTAAEFETAARLFEHRERGLCADGRGGIEPLRAGGGAVLFERVFIRGVDGVHGDCAGDAQIGNGQATYPALRG